MLGRTFAGSFRSEWIRWSKYKLLEFNGDFYISPEEDADFRVFNPYETVEQVVVDLLSIGQAALRENAEESALFNLCLSFASRYGLLGLMCASADSVDFTRHFKVVLPHGNPIGIEGEVPSEDYAELFFPGGLEAAKKAEQTPRLSGDLPALQYSKYYAEQPRWILAFAKSLYLKFLQLCHPLDFAGLATKETSLPRYLPARLDIGIELSGGLPVFASYTHTLKGYIDLIYAMLITSDSINLKMCKHCSTLFVSTNLKMEYCSASCRNCYNVKNSRTRAKNL